MEGDVAIHDIEFERVTVDKDKRSQYALQHIRHRAA